ncbi:MAG: hypothetical protein ACI8PZ_005880 [Myxococcota bacterium]|jgi:hypothetical protein
MRWLLLCSLTACGGADRVLGDTSEDLAETTPTSTGGSTSTGQTGTGSGTTGSGTGGTTPADTAVLDTGGQPSQADILSMYSVPGPLSGLTRRLEVELSQPAPIDVDCTTADSPQEHIHLRSPAARSHVVDVAGLLADTEWSCTAATASDTADIALRIDPLPEDFPQWTVETDGTPWGAYTLVHYWSHKDASVQSRAIVVDPEGRPRWFLDHLHRAEAGVEVKWLGEQLLIAGGGAQDHGVAPTLVNLAGEVQFAFPEFAEGGGIWHHDAIVLPDGAILGVATSDNVDLSGAPFTGLRLEARHPDTGELTWTWDSQAAVDAAILPGRDPHGNAIQYVEDDDGPSLWVSGKLIDGVFRIAYPSGEVTWRMGAGADFALFDAAGESLDGSAWFFGQHAIEREGDRLLLYDNGVRAPIPEEDRTSRALELQLDLEARTATVVWEYTEPLWLEPNWGDADRLPNGNRLLGIGHCWSCDGVGEGRSRIIEVTPEGHSVWRLTFHGRKDALYRADRLDGCALFGNRRYCEG